MGVQVSPAGTVTPEMGLRTPPMLPLSVAGSYEQIHSLSCPRGRRVEEKSHREPHVAAILAGGGALRGVARVGCI